MIPEIKQDAVKKALRKAFEVSELEDIRQLTAGLSSALVYRIVVKGNPYLLRIITSTDAMGDPTIQFANMKTAAEAGLAPQVRYLSIEDRISITDFVEAKPLSIGEAKTKLPGVLGRLHRLSPFPKLVNYQDAMDDSVRKFQEAKILPKSMTEALFKQYARIRSIYPHNHEDLVSCHNDLKPENILYDGERVWLVDWEASFLNDRYADLSVVANFVVRSDMDEADYLQAYFGESVDEYRFARFFLARQMTHVFYFTVFMMWASKGKPVDPNSGKSDFRDFHDRIWIDGISLAGDEAKLQYAWVHMDQALKNMETKRFEEALYIVSDYHRN